MPTIFVDSTPYQVKPGENLLKTCIGLGFDLPYFCWHPAMHSVGACRQCAVKQFKDEKDTKGGIVMACMTPVSDGMRISIDDPEARRFRASVIEWFMTNHPHDCPVCDEGGECHLQDMTVMTGHSYRRFRFNKRTHVNQDLGPFVTHEMNRCISCYRCARFYNDYARGTDFGVFASHNHVYFGRAASGTLESAFAGNLVEVCPTGVFTDRTMARHYVRKWDLRTAPSVCVHCGVGCNTIPGERSGLLRRIRNRYNGAVNGYFLCDRGRYGYEFVNSGRRITEPRLRPRKGDSLRRASKQDVLEHVASILASTRRVVGIGSPRASLEANFSLRSLVGEENFYSGTADPEHRLVALAANILRRSPDLTPSVRDVAACDGVLVLGEDLVNTAPILGLAVLQTLRGKPLRMARELKIPYWDDRAVRVTTSGAEGPLFIASTGKTGLDRHATKLLRAGPAGVARTGFAVAHEIDPEAPAVADASQSIKSFSVSVAAALMEAERPLIVSGTGAGSEAVLQAAANIARSLRKKGKEAYLCFAVPECNSLGLGLMAQRGLDEALAAGAAGRVDAAIVLENDLYGAAPNHEVDAFFANVRHVAVVDHLFHRTSLAADVVLPAATFAEGEGTFVNYEGRAQRYFQVLPPGDGFQASWRWFRDLMTITGQLESGQWQDTDGVIASMAKALPVFEAAVKAAPGGSFRIDGMKIAREHQRFSGRTAVVANRTVHEPLPPEDDDSPLTFSMEGYSGTPPSPLIPRFWAPGWNSVQSVTKFQAEVGGELRGGDPGVRLFHGPAEQAKDYFGDVPPPFEPKGEQVLVVPFYHVFGSEELSLLSPGVRSLSPEPYLALSTRDVAALKVTDNDLVTILVDGQAFKLPVKVASELPSGVAGLPAGVPGSPVLRLPLWAEVKKA
jgi:NADH-quinone oxidoreductase subunit G